MFLVIHFKAVYSKLNSWFWLDTRYRHNEIWFGFKNVYLYSFYKLVNWSGEIGEKKTDKLGEDMNMFGENECQGVLNRL